ncbi:MAG TPA: T9SS type A sorting domain-containing protein [Hymenobacter sp.]|jgi:hypothetical protein|uniref:T9SS type A sorting domain-containing protein n=1 Tax=Hymenobacter sp. TaxID=1898978 RepID=UPI002EDB8C19
MKQTYALLLSLAALLACDAARAQHTFTETTLSPYRQDFNTLAGTVTMTGNSITSMPEVYAEAEFNGVRFLPGFFGQFGPNDGNTSAANYYHFGYGTGTDAADRAFGGIGGFLDNANPTPGVGYAGIRFKNGTAGTTITNLEIQYAMEHWYNSTFSTAAKVSVSYLKGLSVTSLLASAGAWQPLADLDVAAPSTATSVGGRDGNAASNRRVVSTTVPVSLLPGEEIMIRWAYVLNSNTNGNGLSIDDVVVTPQTNVFYSKTMGNLDVLSTWGTQPDGSGAAPASFATANQIFYVQSPSATTAADRITGSNTTWAVTGANSKIVVGTPSAPAGLMVEFDNNIVGTIDVGNNSYFLSRRTNAPAFVLGTLAATSTVEYNSNSTAHTIPANQYGNLRVTGTSGSRADNRKQLNGDVVVAGTLGIGNGSNLVLGNYDLTILNGTGTGIPNFSATGYVVANGTGRLRIRVPRAASATTSGTQVTFPVGSSFTSYTPVTLRQTSTTSDDVFEVRMLDKAFTSYAPVTYAPGTTEVASEVVKKTWLISKEVPANPATVAMTLQWNATEATTNFLNAQAHINHYTNGAWDVYKGEVGATGTGPFVVTRNGISSFSPFSVSSRANGALPVELLGFDAKRTGPTVACAWATASEKNNDHFTVERSATGQEFARIGEVKGAGNSTKRVNYAFEDKAPLTGLSYYRLRQTDTDGTVSYSPVVTVQAAGAAWDARVTAVPNPSAGRFEIWTSATEVLAAEVFNILGVRVPTQATLAAHKRLQFDLSSQPAGVYFVRVQTTTGTQVVRITKN